MSRDSCDKDRPRFPAGDGSLAGVGGQRLDLSVSHHGGSSQRFRRGLLFLASVEAGTFRVLSVGLGTPRFGVLKDSGRSCLTGEGAGNPVDRDGGETDVEIEANV